MIDAQSTRGSAKGGESDYGAGNKVIGRKRLLVVDVLGLLLAVSITAVKAQDRDGPYPVVEGAMKKYPSIQALYTDSGYVGQYAQILPQSRYPDLGRAPSGQQKRGVPDGARAP